jgi:5'-nucleotidase
MVHNPTPPSGPQATYSSGRSKDGAPEQPDLRILHYNDVYHIDPSSAEPVGGISRFMTVCKEYQEDQRFKDQSKLMTFFSGDAFNPSLESTVTKGELAWSCLLMAFTDKNPTRQAHGSGFECHWDGLCMCWKP